VIRRGAIPSGPFRKKRSLQTIGWREWVKLPELGCAHVKAKVDTGGRSSSLHAYNVEITERDGIETVTFEIHPLQRSEKRKIRVEAPLLEMRTVRSSGGHETLRAVIETEMELMGERWSIELTLASRDEMDFRMLLGRQAIRGRFAVDPGRSFFGGKPKQKRKKLRKKIVKKIRRSKAGDTAWGLQSFPERHRFIRPTA
jgi:hypothetical protein